MSARLISACILVLGCGALLLNLQPTAAQDAGEPVWRAAFHRVYAPEVGQIMKRVAPPLIPKRRDWFLQHSRGGPDATVPTWLLIHWEDDQPRFQAGSMGDGTTVARAARDACGIELHLLQGDSALLKLELKGDLVVRREASQQQKLDALSLVIREAHQKEVSFKPIQVDHEVIIVRGEYRRAPVPGLDPGPLHLIGLPLQHGDDVMGMGSGTLDDILAALGRLIGQPVQGEIVNSPTGRLRYVTHLSATAYSEKDREATEQAILNNFARQMGLQIIRARKQVQAWELVEGLPDDFGL